VRNLEQDPGLVYRLQAPAYRALRTDLYVHYATGQRELYDMSIDPAQLESRHRDRRYRAVRQWLFAKLTEFSACAGASCQAGVGTEPLPTRAKRGRAN
jgi:N-acetylglucosamine-6-sulfatase